MGTPFKMKGSKFYGKGNQSPIKGVLQDAGDKVGKFASSDTGKGAITGLAAGGLKGAVIGGLLGHLTGKKKKKEEEPKEKEQDKKDPKQVINKATMSKIGENLKNTKTDQQ